MYATLKIKPKIGSGYRYTSRFGWVARIIDTDSHYGFKREFIRAIEDYTYAAKSGRGVIQYFFLAPGIYDVFQPLSWKHNARYFIQVYNSGEYEEISKEKVIEWLNQQKGD